LKRRKNEGEKRREKMRGEKKGRGKKKDTRRAKIRAKVRSCLTHQDMQVFPYFGLQIMTSTVLGENVHSAVVSGDIGRTDPALCRGPIGLPIALLLEIACRRAHFFSKRNRESAKTGEKKEKMKRSAKEREKQRKQ